MSSRVLRCGWHLSVLVVALLTLFCGSLARAGDWLGPNDVVASADGKRLMVACIDARQILAVDVASGKVAAGPAKEAIETYRVEERDGFVYIATD